MTPGTCHYCGCTEDRACAGGCSWTDTRRILCSRCRAAEVLAATYLQALQRALADTPLRTWSPRSRVPWSALPAFDRQALVMVCRRLIDAVERQPLLPEIEGLGLGPPRPAVAS